MKLLLAIMLLTAACATAVAEEIHIGPYVVSFDLNTTANYNLTTNYFAENNSTSVAEIGIKFDNDTSAQVDIFNDKEWQFAGTTSCCTVLKSLALKEDPDTINYSVSQRIIDGKVGDVVTKKYKRPSDGRVLNATLAEYWPDSREIEGYNISAGKTKVELIAIFPENMSNSLIDTLHVELPEESEQLGDDYLMDYSDGLYESYNNAGSDNPLVLNIANNSITVNQYFVNLSPLVEPQSHTSVIDIKELNNTLASLGISPELLSSPEAMNLSKILVSGATNAGSEPSSLGSIMPSSEAKTPSNTTANESTH
jgi:hypothetical protein